MHHLWRTHSTFRGTLGAAKRRGHLHDRFAFLRRPSINSESLPLPRHARAVSGGPKCLAAPPPPDLASLLLHPLHLKGVAQIPHYRLFRPAPTTGFLCHPSRTAKIYLLTFRPGPAIPFHAAASGCPGNQRRDQPIDRYSVHDHSICLHTHGLNCVWMHCPPGSTEQL